MIVLAIWGATDVSARFWLLDKALAVADFVSRGAIFPTRIKTIQ